MQSLFDMIAETPLAVVFGLAGLACQLAWPMFSTRRIILAVQFGIGASYGIQYAMLEAWSGAGICMLGATQTLVAFCAGDRPWLRRMALVFLPLVAATCIATWSGASSLLALTACSLIMLGRLQNDTLRLRILMLAAAPFGLGYDLAVGAMPAFCGGLTSALIAAMALVRELRARGFPGAVIPAAA